MKSFAHIFRREGIRAQVIEGDSFHRYNRVEMRELVQAADRGSGPQVSHFGPEANLLRELADTFVEYGATGRARSVATLMTRPNPRNSAATRALSPTGSR